jgi:hypothetical protein
MHRRNVLLARETAMLPAMQIFVEAKQKYNEAVAETSAIVAESKVITKEKVRLHEEVNRILKMIRQNWTEENTVLREQYKNAFNTYYEYLRSTSMPIKRRLRHAQRRVYEYGRLYMDGTNEGEQPIRREFIMRCQANECRGFISNVYVCGTCRKKTCSECLEVEEEGHTCKPESIESAKAIKKETRPCPKCGTRIFKIDGCDQMWCTVADCNTAFSWNSGHIVSGKIHNPHYYEWLRRQGGGTAEREAGDIPCGGLPNGHLFTNHIFIYEGLSEKEKNDLWLILRKLFELEERLLNYPSRLPALANKEHNVAYLMNQIDEKEWKRQLEFTEAKFNRKKEIGQILQTLVTTGADIMAGIYERISAPQDEFEPVNTEWIRNTGIVNLEGIRVYTNEALTTIGNSMHIAVPQIDKFWGFVPPRILYKDTSRPPPLDTNIIVEQ